MQAPAFTTLFLPISRHRHAPLPQLSRSPQAPPVTTRRRRRRAATIVAARTPDWYKELAVSRDATPADIKRAYRRAALKNHPDVSSAPDAAERFMRVQDAYAVLSDAGKRAAYDRQLRVDDWTGGGGDGARTSAPGSGFDSAEYAKTWRERNPMPEDIGDNFSSIFSDLFSGVKSAVETESPGIVEDFVDFLEKNVGIGSPSSSSDGLEDSLEEILLSSDEGVLAAEEDDALFVQNQLETRREKLREEKEAASRRAEDWARRARAAESQRDFITRDAAKDREADLRKEVRRFEKRARKTAELIRDQEVRLKKIRRRLDEVRRGVGTSARRAPAGSTASGFNDSRAKQKEAIDEELERMKREMGL